MSRSHLLIASAALAVGLAVPDLQTDVDALKERLALLERRVAALESHADVAPNGDRRPKLTADEVRLLQLKAVEEQVGFDPATLGDDLAARAWRAKVGEAAIQGFQFALQVAGNDGLLRVQERPELGSLESLRGNGARIAASALDAKSVSEAYGAIEAGVRESLLEWANRRGGDPEAKADELVQRWRSAGLSIVREKLEEGVRWRAAFAKAAQE